MRSAQSDRKKIVDGVDMCWCATHKDYLPCDQFYLRPKSITGHDYCCMECVKVKSQLYRYKRLGYDKMDDKTATNVVLSLMGYDPHSEVSVHEQFIQKHYERI